MAKKINDWNLQIKTAQFLADTQFWSLEEKGMYITLICVHHQQGSIPKEIMHQVCGGIANPKDEYPLLMKHFVKLTNGNYSHPETENEMKRREEYSKAQKTRADRRWCKKDATAYATADAKTMPRDRPEHSVLNSLSSSYSLEETKSQTLGNESQALEHTKPQTFNQQLYNDLEDLFV